MRAGQDAETDRGVAHFVNPRLRLVWASMFERRPPHPRLEKWWRFKKPPLKAAMFAPTSQPPPLLTEEISTPTNEPRASW